MCSSSRAVWSALTVLVGIAAMLMWGGCASSEQAQQPRDEQPNPRATEGDDKPYAQSESLPGTTTALPPSVPAYEVFDEELCATLATYTFTGVCMDVHSEAVTKANLAAIADHIRSREAAESRAKSKTPVDRIQIRFYVPGFTPDPSPGPFEVKPPPEQTGTADVYNGEEGLKSVYFDNTTEDFIAEYANMDYMKVLTRDELPYRDAEIPPEVAEETTLEETTAEEEPPAQYAPPQDTSSEAPPASTVLAPQDGTGPEYQDIDRYPCEYFDLQTLCVTVQSYATPGEEQLAIARDVRSRDTTNEVDRIFFYSPASPTPVEGAQDDNLSSGQVVAYRDSAVVKKAFPDSTEEELQASESVGNVVSVTEPSTEETTGEAPEELLDVQYRLLDSGLYQGAYELFDRGSRQKVTLEQYEDYFKGTEYDILEYSITSVDRIGDEATVNAALTVDSTAGEESYEVSQQMVREDGVWRVVMRDEQVAAFTEAK